jgi:putative transposase
VINRAAAKAPLFTKPRDYREFLAILREGLKRHPVPIVAYCILANHWHFVIGPTGTNRLSSLMHWVSTTHAVRFRIRHKTVGHGPVYQGRFKAKGIDAAHILIQTCRYVERNALTAGLVRRAQDWPWGSLADRRQASPAVPLKTAHYLTSDAWVDYVNQMVTLDDLAQNPRLGAEGGPKRRDVFRRAHGDEADAHIEGAEHLGVVELAGALQPREQRRNRPAAAVK